MTQFVSNLQLSHITSWLYEHFEIFCCVLFWRFSNNCYIFKTIHHEKTIQNKKSYFNLNISSCVNYNFLSTFLCKFENIAYSSQSAIIFEAIQNFQWNFQVLLENYSHINPDNLDKTNSNGDGKIAVCPMRYLLLTLWIRGR